MASEQLYRECTNCDVENHRNVGDGTEQNPFRDCPDCGSTGWAPVEPPNVPAIVAAARKAVDDQPVCPCHGCRLEHKDHLTALREALASAVAPLTEAERDHVAYAIETAAFYKTLRTDQDLRNARVDAIFAKLVELRPELAPYLGVGDA